MIEKENKESEKRKGRFSLEVNPGQSENQQSHRSKDTTQLPRYGVVLILAHTDPMTSLSSTLLTWENTSKFINNLQF